MANLKKFNFVAPLSVSIVVITLGAAFGVLSGRGAFVGMVSTSVIALITALVGGSRYGVSSPTGPMTAAIAVILLSDQEWLAAHHSNLDVAALVNLTLMMAAVILFSLTLCRVQRLVKLVPHLVVSGFVNGIALLIVLAQLRTVSSFEDGALMTVTFLVAMGASIAGKRFTHLAWRILTSSLCVIVGMSVVAYFLKLPVSYIDLSSDTQVALAFPPVSYLTMDSLLIVFPLAFELAMIALLDTLLTAIIMDKKTKTKTQLERELTGQSLSLWFLSFIGGIPGAQSTVPSMMMYQEEGHHKFSKLALALFCVMFTFIFAELIGFVPLAVFGGVILKIAFDVADFTSLKSLATSKSRNNLLRIFVAFGTCLSTVLLSLNLAVIGFTFFFVMWNQVVPSRFRILDLIGSEQEGLEDEL